MPIWLRKFTFNEINEFYKTEHESYKKSSNPNTSTLMDSSGKINSPEFMKNVKKPNQPNYVTRASKK